MSDDLLAERPRLLRRPIGTVWTTHRLREALDRPALIVAVLILLLALLVASVLLRSFELDEGYSVMLVDARPRLDWPGAVFSRSEVRSWVQQHSRLDAIPGNLRTYDVHPPLWFFAVWCWRALVGSGLVAARSLSALLTCVNVVVFLAVARRVRAPRALASALCFLAYVTVYTGATLRMYPLALMFLLLGVLFLLRTLQQRHPGVQIVDAASAGLCFGLGALTHMLVLFPGLAMCMVVAWFLARRRRFGAIAALAAAPLPFLAWASTFFLVQDRRDWQFPQFRALQMLRRIAQDEAAALLGGTPLSFTGSLQLLVGGLLVLLLVAVAVAGVVSFAVLRREPETCVVAAGAVTMPAALFGLGLAFHHQASEPRYML